MPKTEEDELNQLTEEARMLISDLRQSVATPAEAMTVLCIALWIMDYEYRKPGATVEDCINTISENFRDIEKHNNAAH